jgi:hypothetical protein
MVVTVVFLGIFSVLRLVIGVQLLFNAKRNNLPNLYWLGVLFLVNFVSLLFLPLPGVNNPLSSGSLSLWIGNGYAVLTGLALIAFIRTTFYVNRPSPHRWFLGVHLAISAIALYGITASESYSNPNPLVAGFYLSAAILWAWHAVIAYQALVAIQGDKNVEDWVKGRYQWMIGYAVIAAVGSLINGIRIAFNVPSLVTILGLLALLANIFTVIPQFLVWSMPDGFRKWLNRKQQTPENSEQLGMISILGTAMMRDTNLKSIACLYALRSAVEKRIGIEDSDALGAYINTMSYKEWETVFLHSELRRILLNSGADNTVVDRAIANAQRALVEKQSFLTLHAH